MELDQLELTLGRQRAATAAQNKATGVAELAGLQKALGAAGQSKADLLGLDEDYARAEALRGSNTAKINQYGYVSPYAVLADVVNQDRGRHDMRGLDSQRKEARQNIANAESVLPMYNATQAQNAQLQAQDNLLRGEDNTRVAASVLAQTKRAREIEKDAAKAKEHAAQVAQWGATNKIARDTPVTVGANTSLVTREGVPLFQGVTKLNPQQEKARAKLAEGAAARQTAIDKGAKILQAFNSGAKSGTTRGVLNAIPSQFTDQAAFDQELDAYAEQAARAMLNALGEIRPTDTDVKGAKESLFGVGKGEQVNKNLITEYLQNQMALENEYRVSQGLEPQGMPNVENLGEGWYNKLFEQSAGNPSDISGASPSPPTATGANGEKLHLINNQWVPK